MTNVVWLVSDQHAADATGYNAHPIVKTPNIDRLAASGIAFERAYTSSPLCVPGRFSLLTGRYPHRTGCVGNGTPLPFDCRTLGHALSNTGYATAFIGKMHPVDPQPHGFDFYIDMGHYYDYLGPKTAQFVRGMDACNSGCGAPWIDSWYRSTSRADHWNVGVGLPMKDPVLPEEDHFEAFVARNCRAFIERYGRKHPFFLVASMIKPHYPYVSPPEWDSLYRVDDLRLPDLSETEAAQIQADLPEGNVQRQFVNLSGAGADTPEIHVGTSHMSALEEVRQYYTAVSYMDDCMGRIVDTLSEFGLKDDTLIVYTSDHGEMLYRHGLRGKGLFYEQSVRVPLVLRHPGTISPGLITSSLTDLTDIVPTVLSLLGIPDALPTDGVDLRPLFADPETRVRDVVYSELGNSWMIRTESHKLVHYDERHRQLFDLTDDPDERLNLLNEPDMADVLSDLAGRANHWKSV